MHARILLAAVFLTLGTLGPWTVLTAKVAKAAEPAAPVATSAPAPPPALPAAYTDGFAANKPWSPRPGVQAQVAPAGDGPALHVWGRQDQAWNYAASETLPLVPGQKYVLSARLRVEKCTPAWAPYLKLEFVARDAQGRLLPARSFGRINSDKYDLGVGQWQVLTAEFTCPAEVGAGWLALEKGTESAVDIDLWLDQVSVRPVHEFPSLARWRFNPAPTALTAVAHLHPRLHMTPAQLLDLRQKIAVEPHRDILQRTQADTNLLLKVLSPDYRAPTVADDEQLWQREIGNLLPHLALCHLLTGGEQYLPAARRYLLAAAAYPTWGGGRTDGMDLAAGHLLYGMALAYDWLYADLDEETRNTVRNCLEKRGRAMYQALQEKRLWWGRAYLQNHQWVNQAGLAAAGLALYGEVADVDAWILLPVANFRITLSALGPDGASHEGVPYWTYGLEYLLKLADLARSLLGDDLLAGSPWFANTAQFGLYSALPQKSWAKRDNVMSFADGTGQFWYGPTYQLRYLAGYYRDGYAQDLAQRLESAGIYGREASYLNLLWHDPTVAPQGPQTLPTFKHFADLGLVLLRSDWSGGESLLAIKCGAHVGSRGLARFSYDAGAGHVHPDAASLLLFACGDWLLSPAGYTQKRTEYHNTLLVAGRGQIGAGGQWFDGAPLSLQQRGPSILLAQAGNDYDLVVADATLAYPDDLGLRRFFRHVLYLKPNCWVIADEVAVAEPAALSLLWHSPHTFQAAAAGQYLAAGKNGKLRLSVLAPADAVLTSQTQTLLHPSGQKDHDSALLTVSSPSPAAKQLFVTVLQAAPASGEFPPPPTITTAPSGLTLHLPQANKTWQFHLQPDRPAGTVPLIAAPPP